MEKFKLFLKNTWSFLDGKKRNIALIYWSVLVPSMSVIWPDGYQDNFALIFSKCVIIFGFFLSALGLGHAAIKMNKNSVEEEEKE